MANYAFIDSQNLNRGTLSSGWKLDFGKFRLFLRNKYGVEKAFLFIGYVSGNSGLYQYLQEHGYILIFKPVLAVKTSNGLAYKGNVDAELVLHTMIEIENFDQAVIVTGDGEFHCLVEYLEKKKKLAKIVVPNNKYSSLLKDHSKYIFQLSTIKGKMKTTLRHKKRGIPAVNNVDLW